MRRVHKDAPTKIGDLFEVYRKRLRAPQGSVIQTVIEVIHDLLNIDVPKESFSYTPHSRMLRINAHGPLKSEIFLHREEILEHLKGRLGPQDAPKTIL